MARTPHARISVNKYLTTKACTITRPTVIDQLIKRTLCESLRACPSVFYSASTTKRYVMTMKMTPLESIPWGSLERNFHHFKGEAYREEDSKYPSLYWKKIQSMPQYDSQPIQLRGLDQLLRRCLGYLFTVTDCHTSPHYSKPVSLTSSVKASTYLLQYVGHRMSFMSHVSQHNSDNTLLITAVYSECLHLCHFISYASASSVVLYSISIHLKS